MKLRDFPTDRIQVQPVEWCAGPVPSSGGGTKGFARGFSPRESEKREALQRRLQPFLLTVGIAGTFVSVAALFPFILPSG